MLHTFPAVRGWTPQQQQSAGSAAQQQHGDGVVIPVGPVAPPVLIVRVADVCATIGPQQGTIAGLTRTGQTIIADRACAARAPAEPTSDPTPAATANTATTISIDRRIDRDYARTATRENPAAYLEVA